MGVVSPRRSRRHTQEGRGRGYMRWAKSTHTQQQVSGGDCGSDTRTL
jgi:hypothetical protein